MKVLMLGWELPPHHVGGMGVACYQMCKELSYNGVDIEFILPFSADFNIDFMKVTPAHNQTAEEFAISGGVYDASWFSINKKSKTDIGPLDLRRQHDRYAHNVSKLVETREFDVIHAHDWLTFKAGMMAKHVTGKPLIVHVHATQYDQSAGGHGNPEAREIEYQAFSIADQIFAVSNYTKNIIVREYGIDESKVHVVHNSMEVGGDIDESFNAHHYLHAMRMSGYKVVVNVGRLTIQKGLTHLLEAAQKVVNKDPKVLFLIAGSGEQQQELMNLAAHYKISRNVIFESWISGKNLRDTYKIGNVFIMPSVSEPFGLTALEAVGYGTPVIVSKQSGVSEVLSNCFKVDFWDTEQMADMILSITTYDSLANTMWRNSYNEYKEQSWSKSAQTMNDRYHHTIGAYR
jgi:glycosyltransferase involved in cell wall biosynthesis